MKLLVTGGAGFIGSNFIRYWLSKYNDDHIVNLDALTYAGNRESIKDIESDPRHSFIEGDIRDMQVVEHAMNGCDMVVHFAAESHVDRSVLDAAPFVTTNVVGTYVLLEVAKKYNVKRFHHVSTDEVFGSLALDSQEQFNEETRYNPRSPYSASKAASDHLVRSYFFTYDLPITITNTENNYGPYLFPEKLLALAITNVLEGKKIPIYGDGKNVRDWLYVEDHCYGIDLVLQKGRPGETYCIGGLTQDLNNLDVVRKVLAILEKDDSWMEFVEDRPGHDRRYAVDWSKAKRELGYNPQASFDVHLAKMVKWYKENTWWWKPLKEKNADYFKKQYG